jgi:hypothetical protein
MGIPLRARPAIAGTAAVAHLILSATDPTEAARDATGRRLIQATLPPADPRDGYGDLLAGAELSLTLDVDGDVARVAARSAQDDPDLVLGLDIMRLGEPQPIAPPDGGDAGLRRTVPVDELDAVGVRPVELGRVPERWTLIGAWVIPAPAGPPECLRLYLSYRDPDAVTCPGCGGQMVPGRLRVRERSRASSFSGSLGSTSGGATPTRPAQAGRR